MIAFLDGLTSDAGARHRLAVCLDHEGRRVLTAVTVFAGPTRGSDNDPVFGNPFDVAQRLRGMADELERAANKVNAATQRSGSGK